MTEYSFLLVGTDAEGETRQSTHPSLDTAVAVGRECSTSDACGPVWRSFEVWGNHPQTGEWAPLVSSILARFRLGRLVSTQNARARISFADILRAIGRHQAGDWGDVSADSRFRNEAAIENNSRIRSVYHDSKGAEFWLITEADRSVTTVLLPGDY